MSRACFHAAASLGCLVAVAAQGEVPLAKGEDEALAELQVLLNTPVVSASKREQKALESPQAIEVLTGDQIRASGAFRLMDLLKLMTGVQVYDLDGQVSRVAMRGVAPNTAPKTIQVLVDGVALYNSESFPLDIEGLPVPLDVIERVEVVRGPSSSLYGANAQLGVISITTRRAAGGPHGSLRAAGTNNGGFRAQGAYFLDEPGLRLTAGFGDLSDRRLDEPQRSVGRGPSHQPENQYHHQQVFLRPEVDFAGASLWAEYGKSSKRTGSETATSAAGVGLYTIGTLGLETEIAQAGWSQDWGPTLKSTRRINRTNVLYGLGGGLAAVPGNPQSPALVSLVRAALTHVDTMEWLTDYRSLEAAFQVNWDMSEALHWVLGGDARKMDTPGSKVQGIPALQPTASGGFLSVDWKAGPAILSAGLRAENETLGGSRTSPRFAVVVPTGAGTFRAGYFTSTRSPQMTEMFGNLNSPVVASISTANPDLRPEEAVNLEAGYRRTFARWSLDLTLYRMKLRKFIASTVVGVQGGKPVTQFRNSGGDLTNQGLEGTLKGEILPGWLMGLDGTYLDYRDEARDAQQYFAPRSTATLWTRARSGPLFGYLALQHLGAYTRFSPSSNKSEEEGANLQVHFNGGMEFGSGLSLSLYGVNAAHPVVYTGAAGFQNQFLSRYARREVGLQGAWRF